MDFNGSGVTQPKTMTWIKGAILVCFLMSVGLLILAAVNQHRGNNNAVAVIDRQ